MWLQTALDEAAGWVVGGDGGSALNRLCGSQAVRSTTLFFETSLLA